MSLTQASDPENMQVKINSSDKQSKNGDEQIEGMSVSDVPEFQDPAILVVREIARIRYSKEQLLSLKDVPFSKKKPDFLDSSEVSPSILDPERWNFDRKKPQAASNAEGGASVTSAPDEHRRRPGGADPRERVRKEGDGIVLSPQRRSFNSGCFVPTRGGGAGGGEGGSRNVVGGRPHSPLGANTGKNDGHVGIREIQPSNNRRIGSGRILRDSWDFNDKPDSSTDDYGGGFRNQPQRDRDDKLYERRSFGRDFDVMTRERSGESQKDRRNNGRFDRRRISEREQEEPEWFSGGPVSQNDTIELRGFDDCDRPGKKKLSPSRIRRAKDWSKKKNNEAQPAAAVATAAANVDGINEEAKTVSPIKVDEEVKKPKDEKEEDKSEDVDGMLLANDSSFNFDEILKCDTIPGLLTNGVGGDGDNQAKSRFSRWFKKQDSPEKRKPEESRVSATPDDDDQRLIKDLLKDISETSVSIPGDSESYFAPISPASNTTNAASFAGRQQQGMSIMEMLQRGKIQQQQQQGEQQQGVNMAKQSAQMAGKILSLDELEAKMRQNVDVATGMPQKHPQQKPDEEMTAAFKKLLSQAQGGGHPVTSNGPINKSQPMSLLEMLNHSQQQDEAVRLSVAASSHLLGPSSPNIINHHHQMHQVNDLQLKLQHAQYHQQQKQMEMLNKLINATAGGGGGASQLRTSPSLHDMGAQQSRELLSRPEAQAILQGLKRGEITTQHLYQQLANPALQPRHRDMLTTILKVQGGGYGGPSPRVLSPVPPPTAASAHHMYPQQQLRVSPLPPNALHQRIPSPRELQVHTQNILQRALIKKKLEEQQENYRKKQELQRGQSPGVCGANGSQSGPKSVASPTPLAFTPTSVLRKMTADKDEGKENKAAGDAKIPPGRPVTGMRPQLQQPQSQQWAPQYTSVKQPVGRPIVKANNSYQSQTAEQFFTQQQQQRIFNQAIQAAASAQQPALQQQQQRKPNGPQYGPGQAPSGVAPSQYPYQSAANQQFAQQLTQQQLRAQHQHRPANQQQGQQQQPMGFQQQQSQQQAGHQHQGIGAAAWQQFFNTAQQAASRASNSSVSGRSISTAGGGCDLSPTTSDQLARWFSPDLLAKARGGELPSTAGLGQHALSLEEIERQTAPPVHN